MKGTHQLLPEDELPDLAVPAGEGRRELGVERARARAVRRALAHLELDEELPGDVPALLQHLLPVDPDVRVLKRPVRGADLLEPRDAGLDEVVRDPEPVGSDPLVCLGGWRADGWGDGRTGLACALGRASWS